MDQALPITPLMLNREKRNECLDSLLLELIARPLLISGQRMHSEPSPYLRAKHLAIVEHTVTMAFHNQLGKAPLYPVPLL